MRNKWLIRGGIILAVITGLYLALKLTFILTPFKITSVSGQPGLKKGSTVWASRLKKTGANRVVCFRHSDSLFGKVIWVFRQVATAGDVVEIRGGTAFVNGRNADTGLKLNHTWRLPLHYRDAINAAGLIPADMYDMMPEYVEEGDSITLVAETGAVKQAAPQARMRLNAPGDTNHGIQQQWRQPWNEHYFGPVTVPDGHIFVLGDNRDYAQDSRYIGFIPLKKVVAVVL